jgi:hypothetical protein
VKHDSETYRLLDRDSICRTYHDSIRCARIAHAPAFMKALSHLGYPPYFSNLLGLGKLIGVCVLLAPGLPKVKEWAYVAFGITVLSACYSHYNAGDGWLALEPLITLAALMISYRTRPTNRAFLNHQE